MKFTHPPESRPLEGYTIKRAIHRGGFGEVYYALSDGGKEVALKLLHQHTDIELRGARQCLNLSHPNLVTIFDIREDTDGDSWIIMEYVGGKRLADVLEEQRTLSIDETLDWLTGICSGLDYLHNRGLVHRDMKPSNIFREGEVVKIGDVGLSKFISESRRSAHTQSVGTLYYMAPEISHGRYGREVDIYALGIILHEMLTGELPFDGETTGEILMKHLTEKPDLAKVPKQLQPVIAGMLEKDPLKRTATAPEVLRQYHTAIGNSPIGINTTNQRPSDEPVDIPEDSFASPYDVDQYVPTASHTRLINGLWIGAIVVLFACPQLVGIHPRFGWVLGTAVAAGYFAFAPKNPGKKGKCFPKWQSHCNHKTKKHGRRQQREMPAAKRVMPAVAQQPREPKPRSQPVGIVPRWDTPRTISWRQRLADLTGSMVLSSVLTFLIAFVLYALDVTRDENLLTLFSATSILGTWTILGTNKLMEGSANTAFVGRAWPLAFAGLFMGLAAYQMDQNLFCQFPESSFGRFERGIDHIGEVSLISANNQPTAAAYVLYFVALFGLRGWWKLTDAYRGKLLSVWSLILTAAISWVIFVGTSLPIYPAVGMAVILSFLSQVSSAWTPPRERPRITPSNSHLA
ncbi:serine/threonine-protein kinase [Calycomorphotria hydatis]|nr:serine/threonine-protein kinase [Calycomorphotria hydatis]